MTTTAIDLMPIELAPVETIVDRAAFLRSAVDRSPSPRWAEFGVGRGASARILADALPPEGRLWLFDSWEGLPAPWDRGDRVVEAGRFRCAVPAFPDPRVTIVKGLFAETLPYAFSGPVGLVHIDVDLYQSAVEVLAALTSHLADRAVLIFDEVWGYPAWRHDEYRALQEWLAATGHTITWFARGGEYRAAGVWA